MTRYGAVSYLNARPLLEGLAQLVLDTPARLVQRFEQRAVDIALLPVAAAEAVGLRRVGSLGVTADGPVGSVFVFLRVPPAEVRTVHLDPDSRTSRVLARLVLRRVSGREPGEVEDPAGADAELVIGDPALVRAGEGGARLDLAEEWRRWTGLPFVFAAWYGAPDLAADDARAIATALEAAYAKGSARLDRYVAEAGLPVPDARLREYLRERIRYRIGEREARGLARFLREMREAGLGPPEALR